MLIGKYFQNLDSKGRVNVPSKLRADLGESFVVTQGVEECIVIYPKEEWERFEAVINAVPGRKGRELSRFFFSNAEECSIDAQGRTLIPPAIREYGHLKKEVVVIGSSKKVEIWDREEWEKREIEPQLSGMSIADVMEELPI